MIKIITLTPNPALDVSGHVSELVPNEKNYVRDERRDPGGNGINSARIATRLNACKSFPKSSRKHSVEILATGPLGGQAGDEIKQLLKNEKIKARFVSIRGFTRTNITVTEDCSGLQTRLTFPGPRVSSTEIKSVFAQIRRFRGPGIFLLGGSLPEGCPDDFHIQVTRLAQRQNLGVIVDVPSKYLKSLLESLKSPLLMIKPNQTELEEWVGHKLTSDQALAEASQKLTRYSKIVCTSLAERGAMITVGHRTWFAQAPKIEARGTVGAGDSMVGATTFSLASRGVWLPEHVEECFERRDGGGSSLPSEIEDALKWGLAAGAATAEVVGTSLARPEEIVRLQPMVKISAFSG